MRRLLLSTVILLACSSGMLYAESNDADSLITRKEFIQELISNVSAEPQKAADMVFKDVNATDPAYADIQKAYSLGWIAGTTEGNFEPNGVLTREQMAAVFSRVYCKMANIDKNQLVFTTELVYRDQGSVSDWARTDVRLSYSLGLLTCSADGLIRPREFATETESALGIEGLKSTLKIK